jgi:hypothetical protein
MVDLVDRRSWILCHHQLRDLSRRFRCHHDMHIAIVRVLLETPITLQPPPFFWPGESNVPKLCFCLDFHIYPLKSDEQKNAPELPTGCFLIVTHRRQPGDFVRSPVKQ